MHEFLFGFGLIFFLAYLLILNVFNKDHDKKRLKADLCIRGLNVNPHFMYGIFGGWCTVHVFYFTCLLRIIFNEKIFNQKVFQLMEFNRVECSVHF